MLRTEETAVVASEECCVANEESAVVPPEDCCVANRGECCVLRNGNVAAPNRNLADLAENRFVFDANWGVLDENSAPAGLPAWPALPPNVIPKLAEGVPNHIFPQ